LALLDINEQAVRSVGSALSASYFAVDLTHEDAVRASVRAAADALGGLDGIANVAGMVAPAPIGETTLANWNLVLAVNLTGAFIVCREALPFLDANARATIVNVSSASAFLPVAVGLGAYAASKAGLVAFSKAMAYELAPKIRVNAVCPGAIDTPMLMDSIKAMANDPARSPYALKRVSDPLEIAQAILYLTSDESSYVTGAALAVDGGRTFH
jgi:NAD(P)-dependent dehydrogenase (short-subunit alcohol dehydrogenase family)